MANYIFGNNKGGKDGEKIAMTSPVGIEEDFRSMKGGKGEKIAMTSPVATAMDGQKYGKACNVFLAHGCLQGFCNEMEDTLWQLH